MPPVLPSSLSPHICILPSPDLKKALAASSLPPLPSILQSFSPLSQITTRTTALASVPHASFALRFSDLSEVEQACKEDEEQRAVRTIDWIGARIHKRCARWVQDVENLGDREPMRTPWWDELRRCAEGDCIPSRTEGWNHPVAVVLAASTASPNPLQAITALHARSLELPSWVDTTILRYTLIVHPQNSPLSNEEAGALFNAVKKQYGLHTYLLPLVLPSPPPLPVTVPTPAPRLPPPPSPESPQPAYTSPTTPEYDISTFPNVAAGGSGADAAVTLAGLNTLRLSEPDIQQTAKFVREFVLMSLVPWMEKCVLEWNENFSSTRRLPSRLFSSTRRLFGTSSQTSPPPHATNPSPSGPSRSQTLNGTSGPGSNPPPSQQRRLAEFSTILGDFKLAVAVWEALRKEGKGGLDILPLLLTPTPNLSVHASNALASIYPPTPDLPAHVQLRALLYAIRWEVGIGHPDFSSEVLEGERWLVWASGNAEEPPSAILLAHAALLSSRKGAKRRAALWYLVAANRLEKCGIKPLTMYFLRRAHGLYKIKPEKTLSPSFWESEGRSPNEGDEFDAILSGIEHPLGRLLYTTGDVAGAVRFFLGLLRGSSASILSVVPYAAANGDGAAKAPGSDDVYLQDFRVAFTHLKNTVKGGMDLSDLKLPFNFCVPSQIKVRLPREIIQGDLNKWEQLEEDWRAFWKTRGKERLELGGKAAVDETFWVDIVLRNPLDAEVNLSDFTVVIYEKGAESRDSAKLYVEVEVIDDITLRAKESRTIPIAVKCSKPISLTIAGVSYTFISLLPAVESLASRGCRLQATALHRQSAMYAPDVFVNVNVEEASQKLLVNFVDDSRLVLAQGESKPMSLWLSNGGTGSIGELWMVCSPEDEISVNDDDDYLDDHQLSSLSEVMHSDNSITPPIPHSIRLRGSSDQPRLEPGDSQEFPVVLHTERIGGQDLCVMFTYRQGSGAFHCVRVSRTFEVRPVFEVSATAEPSRGLDHFFSINLELDNVTSSHAVQVTQVTSLSPSWECTLVGDGAIMLVPPHQTARLSLGANKWEDQTDPHQSMNFVSRKLRQVVLGQPVELTIPPPVDVLCNHISKTSHVRSVTDAPAWRTLYGGLRNAVFQKVSSTHSHIPTVSYPYIFPLFNPFAVVFVLYWEIPSQKRTGHLLVSGVTLGAGHSNLREIVDEAEGATVKRSMYAETQREKDEILESVKSCEWNVEMNPLFVTVQDGVTQTHDFAQGPCELQTTFHIRNYSLTHPSRYTLKLGSTSPNYPPLPHLLPPRYSGRLTFRGVLAPMESNTLHPKMWVTRPGSYSLGGWVLETDVGELSLGIDTSKSAWRTRDRYIQGPPIGDGSSVTICDL